MSADVSLLFERARQICLAQGEVFEKLSHGSPAFFVQKGGQFAALWDNHHNDGNTALLLAQPPGMQESLLASDPEVFYRPPYYGPSGWVGVRLDKTQDWSLVEDLIAQGYEFVAAKRRSSRRAMEVPVPGKNDEVIAAQDALWAARATQIVSEKKPLSPEEGMKALDAFIADT